MLQSSVPKKCKARSFERYPLTEGIFDPYNIQRLIFDIMYKIFVNS